MEAHRCQATGAIRHFCICVKHSRHKKHSCNFRHRHPERDIVEGASFLRLHIHFLDIATAQYKVKYTTGFIQVKTYIYNYTYTSNLEKLATSYKFPSAIPARLSSYL